MTTFLWILFSGILMSVIALVGSITLFLSEAKLKKLLLPLVALAAGTLFGGALLHMIPAAIEKSGNRLSIYLWTVAGFTIFLALEQFLNWHHCHRAPSEHRPLTYLILIGRRGPQLYRRPGRRWGVSHRPQSWYQHVARRRCP
jgi:zinc and cadmium transporter